MIVVYRKFYRNTREEAIDIIWEGGGNGVGGSGNIKKMSKGNMSRGSGRNYRNSAENEEEHSFCVCIFILWYVNIKGNGIA